MYLNNIGFIFIFCNYQPTQGFCKKKFDKVTFLVEGKVIDFELIIKVISNVRHHAQ